MFNGWRSYTLGDLSPGLIPRLPERFILEFSRLQMKALYQEGYSWKKAAEDFKVSFFSFRVNASFFVKLVLTFLFFRLVDVNSSQRHDLVGTLCSFLLQLISELNLSFSSSPRTFRLVRPVHLPRLRRLLHSLTSHSFLSFISLSSSNDFANLCNLTSRTQLSSSRRASRSFEKSWGACRPSRNASTYPLFFPSVSSLPFNPAQLPYLILASQISCTT